MANKNKLDAIIKQRNPLDERQVIKPVDVLAPPVEPVEKTERLARTDEPNESTPEPNEKTERSNRTPTRSKRTVRGEKRTPQPSDTTERMNRTVLDDLKQPEDDTKRKTERFSFEIYTDQKGSIEELRYLYNKRTGKKLSVSRIIREALEEYLHKTLKVFREEE